MKIAAASKAMIPFQEGSKYPPAKARSTAIAPSNPLIAAPPSIARSGETKENAEIRRESRRGNLGFTPSSKGKN